MPVFRTLSTQALPRDTLWALVGAEPFDNEPSTTEIYNNSPSSCSVVPLNTSGPLNPGVIDDAIGRHPFGRDTDLVVGHTRVI